MALQRPKGKGNRFERWIVDRLQAAGWIHARRNFASGGYGGSDVIDGPSDVAIECKKQEKIAIWSCLEQAEIAAKPTDMPVLVFARNRSRVWAAIPFDDLLQLLAERENMQPRGADEGTEDGKQSPPRNRRSQTQARGRPNQAGNGHGSPHGVSGRRPEAP